ncbi:MAG: FHA domain-containing protein [Planctomycetes bacterium]|nr:FHA domain-containing protein [Planctomycetota bacterium]
MLITLRVLHGQVERVIRTDKDTITVGRSKGCTIAIDDPGLSRTHCQFERTGTRLFVRDLNSRNGTRIEGELVSKSVVRPRERITCANAVITFESMEKEPDADDPGMKTVELLLERARPVSSSVNPEAQRLQRMLEMLAPLLRGLDREKSLQGILDAAIALLRAERGFLVLMGAGAPTVHLARNAQGENLAAADAGISRGILRRVLQEGVALLIDDASSDDALAALGSVHALQLRSVLCVPLPGTALQGALWLDHRAPRGGFDHRDLAIVPFFAELAVVALETGERFAEERSRARDLEEDVERGREELVRMSAVLDRVRGEEPLRHDFGRIPARSRAMRTAVRMADRAAGVDSSVVFVGPAGSGKEHLARAVHAQSSRREHPFVAVLCASLPAGLAETELFGRSAAADQPRARAIGGLFGSAAGGCLYLDGLQNLCAQAQAVLLRGLVQAEGGEGNPEVSLSGSVRIMTGSSLSLAHLVAAGRLDEDLRRRLDGLSINLPSLQQRIVELPELIDQLLLELQSPFTLGPEARRALCAHAWPGNLVELKSVLQRLALLRSRANPGRADVEQCIGEQTLPLRDAVDDLERRAIERTLDACGGSISAAARQLGLSRPGLRKMLRRLGLRDSPEPGN